jgi:hypothetical protein
MAETTQERQDQIKYWTRGIINLPIETIYVRYLSLSAIYNMMYICRNTAAIWPHCLTLGLMVCPILAAHRRPETDKAVKNELCAKPHT